MKKLARFNGHQTYVLVERDPLWYGTRYNIYKQGKLHGWCYTHELEFME